MTDPNVDKLTPPSELLDQWAAEYWGEGNDGIANGEKHIATQAARWGADQELEACCEHIGSWFVTPQHRIAELRASRRPKPPSLKEQLCGFLDRMPVKGADAAYLRNWADQESPKLVETILRAIEVLPTE